MVVVGFFVVVIGAVLFYSMFMFREVTDDGQQVTGDGVVLGKVVDGVVDFGRYNYDYVDENVKGILNGMIGGSGRVAFYLPPVGYVNVSRGDKFGVAFALNNPSPSGENMFEYEWTAGSEDCGVGLDVVQGWIERGWMSWGKIPKGWVDHMTVYFSFPLDVEPCSVRYNFEIRKDGVVYGTKVVEFNLV